MHGGVYSHPSFVFLNKQGGYIKLLKSKEVEMTWIPNVRKHYVSKGYEFTSFEDVFIVDVLDLPNGSHKEIEFVCDYCLSDYIRSHRRTLESNGHYTVTKDACDSCLKYKNIDQKLYNFGIPNGHEIVDHLILNKIHKLNGIYKICNTLNNKVYIGSTIDILNRWKDHVNELSNGTHRSKSLSEDYKEFGLQAFKFSIIEYGLEKSNLVTAEHTYIREYRSDEVDYGYNIVSMFKVKKNKSTNIRLLRDSDILEIKKRIANKESHLVIAEDFNVVSSVISSIGVGKSWSHIKTMYDKSLTTSNEGKRVGEKNGCSKLTEDEVKIIKSKINEGKTNIVIGREFNVSRTLIGHIRKGKLWSHVV